jgi:hypothetical protein
VLSAIVLVAINPARQFKLARDSQRMSNVVAILNAVSQNIAENKGVFNCVNVLPLAATVISDAGLDIASCVIPTYISSLPFDPSAPGAHYTDTTDYNTAYTIEQDALGRVTVSSVGEITPVISVTR